MAAALELVDPPGCRNSILRDLETLVAFGEFLRARRAARTPREEANDPGESDPRDADLREGDASQGGEREASS